MTRRIQVFPPSKETPSNSPLTTSGRVDMVTMLDGLTGLMAIASSASLHGMALESKLGGAGWAAASTGRATDASTATATQAGAEAVKIRSIRRFTIASRCGRPTQDGATLRVAHAVGKSRFPSHRAVS